MKKPILSTLAGILTLALVVHPVRKRTRGWSGIFAWQGGGRRRADARQGRQRNHAEIPPGIWFVF